VCPAPQRTSTFSAFGGGLFVRPVLSVRWCSFAASPLSPLTSALVCSIGMREVLLNRSFDLSSKKQILNFLFIEEAFQLLLGAKSSIKTMLSDIPLSQFLLHPQQTFIEVMHSL
jgi:hypothetical protein